LPLYCRFCFCFLEYWLRQFHEQAMNRESGPGMVYMAPYGDTHYYIRFLNEDIYINVKYIKEDIKKLKNWLSRIF